MTSSGAKKRRRCCIQQRLEVRGARWSVTSADLPCTARLLDAGDILEDWERITLLGADLNESFTGAEVGEPVARTSRGSLVLQTLQASGLRRHLADTHTPSYHPYNTAMRPRRLDTSQQTTTCEAG